MNEEKLIEEIARVICTHYKVKPDKFESLIKPIFLNKTYEIIDNERYVTINNKKCKVVDIVIEELTNFQYWEIWVNLSNKIVEFLKKEDLLK
jgi:phenylpyruvate tautomerase PptA (4-oxalocrotonate tautomerase family)